MLKNSELCIDEKMTETYFLTAEKLGISKKKLPSLRYGSSAMLVGCLSPVVVCREDMDEKEASIVFAHELKMCIRDRKNTAERTHICTEKNPRTININIFNK